MSFTKIQTGFEPRQGQAATVEMMVNGGKGKYLANLPGGYGKTLTALMAYYELKDRGEVNRFLYIAPGAQKIFEFDNDLMKDCKKLGRVPIKKGDNVRQVTDAFAYKDHQQNNYEFYSATVQYGINSSGHLIDTMLQTGRWFICVDECHHYTFENKFGGLLDRINYEYMLGLSATPTNWQSPGYFTDLPESNVYSLSLSQGISEGAIRPIKYYTADYFIDIFVDGLNRRMTTSELTEEIELEGLNISTWETQKQLRYTDKYISPLFIKAIDLYNDLTDKSVREYSKRNAGAMPPRPIHQILVFADTVGLAKSYVKLINSTLGDSDFADWVGTGENGRDNKTNFDIIQKYKDGKLPCLVQVSMAGEGFNNPPSSIIVYLSLQYNGNQVTQKIMRGMRRNYLIDSASEDFGYVIVPTDSRAIPEIERLFKQTDVTGELKEKLDREKLQAEISDPWDFPIYRFDYTLLQDVELKDWEEYEDIGITKQQMTQIQLELDRLGYRPTPEELDAAIIRAAFKQKKEVIEEMNREQLRQSIDRGVGSLAFNICKIIHGKSVHGQVIGHMKKAIHSQFNYQTGMRTKEMTEDDLKFKMQWIEKLQEDIKSSAKVPLWLEL